MNQVDAVSDALMAFTLTQTQTASLYRRCVKVITYKTVIVWIVSMAIPYRTVESARRMFRSIQIVTSLHRQAVSLVSITFTCRRVHALLYRRYVLDTILQMDNV
jgi:hypothetical protein